MTLSSILSVEQIIPQMNVATRWEAIDELIARLVECGKITAEKAPLIIEAVKKRENSMSTGVGFGVGLPHASTQLIDEVVGVFGRSSKGINFDALDNQPVKFVVLFLVLYVAEIPVRHISQQYAQLFSVRHIQSGVVRQYIRKKPSSP